jgi:hypothetical protein
MPHKGQEEIMKKATQPVQPVQPADLVTAIAQAVAQVLAQAFAPAPAAPTPAPEPKATRKRKAKDAPALAPAPEPKPARKAKAKAEPAKPEPEPAKAEPAKAKPRRRKASQLDVDQGMILKVAAALSKVDPWGRGLYRLAQILQNRCQALGPELGARYLAWVGQLSGCEAVRFALLGSRDLRVRLEGGER